MAGYIGSQTPVVSNGSQRKYTFTATAAQTVFTGMDIPNPQQIQVFQNGVRLVITTDYTVSSGTTVTLVNAASAGDSLVVILFADYQLLDTDALTFTGGTTIEGDLTVDTNTLYVDSANNRVGIGTSSVDSLLHISNFDATAYSPTATDGQVGVGPTIYLENPANADNTVGGQIVFGMRSTEEQARIGATGGSSPALTFGTADAEAMRIDSNGRVAIGGTTVTDVNMLNIQGSSASSNIGIVFNDTNTPKVYGIQNGGSALKFFDYTASTERMRIDSSGNLLVGKTSVDNTTAGGDIYAGSISLVEDGSRVATFVRKTSDGEIVSFRKDTTDVGTIGSEGGNSLYINSGDTGLRFSPASDAILPASNNGAARDNAIDLGTSGARFDDVYATNGTIQTSDQNEKQQIASLTDAEITAAKAISKLFKTFKWNDSVAEKGDAARTHAGVIAQEVEQAMTDAGLNAGDYAFFISSDWTDEETGEERNRKGIRYPQLMSFIGAATEQRLASIEARLDALEGN